VESSAERVLSEFLGGVTRICDLCPSPHGLLIANQGAEVWALRTDFRLQSLVRINVPPTAPTGLDMLTVDEDGNIYVRAVWDRSVYRASRSSGLCEIARIQLPGGEATPMSIAFSPGFGLVIGDHRHRLWQWTAEMVEPRFWTSVSVLPIRMVHAQGDLWILGAASTPGLVRLSPAGEVRGDVLPRGVAASPSAFLPLESSVVICDFNGGKVVEIAEGGVTTLAENLSAPSAVALFGDDLLVATFGGDSIVRLERQRRDDL
jgi:hypothetical protein